MIKDSIYPQVSEQRAADESSTTTPKMKVEHSLFWISLFNAWVVCAGPSTPRSSPCPDNSSDLTSKCTALAASLNIENATVISSDLVAAGTNLTLPVYDTTCGQAPTVIKQDFCRVALNVSTSSRSGFQMEAWLPSNWTGRFLSVGNGALGYYYCVQFSPI